MFVGVYVSIYDVRECANVCWIACVCIAWIYSMMSVVLHGSNRFAGYACMKMI